MRRRRTSCGTEGKEAAGRGRSRRAGHGTEGKEVAAALCGSSSVRGVPSPAPTSPRPHRPTCVEPLLLSASSLSRPVPDRDPAAMARAGPRSHRRRPWRRRREGGG